MDTVKKFVTSRKVWILAGSVLMYAGGHLDSGQLTQIIMTYFGANVLAKFGAAAFLKAKNGQ